MLRPDRPFDRWFDLADPYDHDVPSPKRQAPDAPREWTYAPTRPEPASPPSPEPERRASWRPLRG